MSEDHEETAKRIVEQARNQNEGVLIELIAAALVAAVEEQKQLGQIAYEQMQTELDTSRRHYQDALEEIVAKGAVNQELRAKLGEATDKDILKLDRIVVEQGDEIVRLKAERDAAYATSLELEKQSIAAFVRGLERAKEIAWRAGTNGFSPGNAIQDEIDKAGK